MVVDVGAFVEVGLIIVIVAIVSVIMRLIRQPLIIGYILSGVIVSPLALNLIETSNKLEIFSKIGVAFLLFTVGLHLNPKFIRDVGKISLITGIGQVLFTSICGFILAWIFGFSTLTSLYIAVALTFSSTIIIMKLLSDKGDVESLYGRITVGFLLVQDLIAILILMTISSLKGGGLVELLSTSLLKGVGLLLIVFFVGFVLLPRINDFIAKSQELLFVFSLGWCFALATIFDYFGFTIEIGALIAGITLSMTPMNYQIASRVTPLRDFFLILFFVSLGLQMQFSNAGEFITPVVVFSAFILIGNPLIVMIIMGLLKYSKRNSFLVSITTAQVSEFSFILIALGVSTGHLNKDILSLLTVIGLLTIAGSTYFILYSDKIYNAISPFLSLFERRGKKVDEHNYSKAEYETILIGCNRIGEDILNSLRKTRNKVLVVDFNPEKVAELVKKGINVRYGDAGDLEMLRELNLRYAKMIISTMPALETNLLLIDEVRNVNKRSIVIVVGSKAEDALRLYEQGATYVLLPHLVGGRVVASMINTHGFSLSKFMKHQFKEVDRLRKRSNGADSNKF